MTGISAGALGPVGARLDCLRITGRFTEFGRLVLRISDGAVVACNCSSERLSGSSGIEAATAGSW